MNPATTRRGFLRLAGMSAAFTTLSQVRAIPPAAYASPDGDRFFDDWETEIVTQIMERIVETGEPGAPRVRDTRAVATVDALCRRLDPGVSEQLRLLLRLIEWGPLLFDFTFTRFTRMDAAEKDASLRAWMESRLGVRRLGFLAIRNLSYVGWYSQEETWPMIGYAGPLLARRGTA